MAASSPPSGPRIATTARRLAVGLLALCGAAAIAEQRSADDERPSSAPEREDSSVQTGDVELPSIEFLLQGWPDGPAQLPPPEDAAPQRTASPTDSASAPALEPAPLPAGFELHKLQRADAPSSAGAEQRGNDFDGFDMRLKWYTAAQSLPAGDALRQLTGKRLPLAHNADMRLMWRRQMGSLRFHADHSTTWLHSDAAGAGSPSLTLDQTPTGDGRRLFDLAWELGGSGKSTFLQRFDRLAVEYRSQHWAVGVGRQAVTWGGGLVFQPMDLFNPFAPTAVDQDYKAGDDMLRVERLFPNGSDLQLLAVARRDGNGDARADASSLAVKYRANVGENEVELMASQHYGGQAYGVGLRIPAGGALVRSDVVWAVEDGALTLSGVVNADYSFVVAGTIVHVFGEYYHNGFGVARLPADLRQLPSPLTARVARGELFNLMRNYLAFGTSFRWHFLVNQSVVAIANLHDSSFAVQTSLTFDASDASRLQAGLTKPFGRRGAEFGGVTVGEGLTVGGGAQAFLRFVYFF